jgi:hypothetical protein
VPEVCPPLCSWKDLTDGTFTIADVEMFNQTIQKLVKDHNRRIAQMNQ